MRQELDEQPKMIGYASREVTKAPEWHSLVAYDILFNNLSTGLFLVAAIGELAAPTLFRSVASVAYPIALGLLMIDLLLLVADLGDPLRFHHMLRVFKPSSPMSLGTWCLTIFSLPLAALAAMSLFVEDGEFYFARRLIMVVGLLPAFGSVAYKGVLFSTTSQPGWKDARWLGSYIINSALTLGCAELMLIAIVVRFDEALPVLKASFMVLMLLNMLLLVVVLTEMREALSRAFSAAILRQMGGLILLGGMLAPLCLLIAGGPFLSVAAALLFVGGALLLRVGFVMLPHRAQERNEQATITAESVPGAPAKT